MKVYFKRGEYHMRYRKWELGEDISDLEELGKTLRWSWRAANKHHVRDEKEFQLATENSVDEDMWPDLSSPLSPLFGVKWEKDSPEVKVNVLLFK